MYLSAIKILITASVYITVSLQTDEVNSQRFNPSADARSWTTKVSPHCSLKEQIAVDRRNIIDISADRRGAAIQALKKESSVLLSHKQLQEFVHGDQSINYLSHDVLQSTNGVPQVKPYLVRAVSMTVKNRSISASWCHQDLLVFSGSLGGRIPEKDPVIALLTQKPRRVVPSYMSAE